MERKKVVKGQGEEVKLKEGGGGFHAPLATRHLPRGKSTTTRGYIFFRGGVQSKYCTL